MRAIASPFKGKSHYGIPYRCKYRSETPPNLVSDPFYTARPPHWVIHEPRGIRLSGITGSKYRNGTLPGEQTLISNALNLQSFLRYVLRSITWIARANFLCPRSYRNEVVSLTQRRLLYTAPIRVLLTSVAAAEMRRRKATAHVTACWGAS